jgi:hypothetical protein
MKRAVRKLRILTTKSVLPLIEITGSDTTWKGGANEIVNLCVNAPSDLSEPTAEFPCSISGKPGLRVRTNDNTFNLTPERVRQLFLTALCPEDYLALKSQFSDEWWIHGDFYDNDGTATQPKITVRRLNRERTNPSARTPTPSKPAQEFDPFNL